MSQQTHPPTYTEAPISRAPGSHIADPAPLGLAALGFTTFLWGEFATSTGITKLGGYIGLLTALAAWYASFAGVTAFTFKREVAPVGPRE